MVQILRHISQDPKYDSGQADVLTLLAAHISAILKFGAGAARIHSRSSLSAELMGGVVFGRHRGSHTARSGQEPHTPGGTIFVVG